MPNRAHFTFFALAISLVLFAGSAGAAMLGGLAMPLNQGEASMSIIMAYSQRDVEDGVDDEASSRRFLFKGAYGLGNKADIYFLAGLSDVAYDKANFDGSLGEALGLGLRYSPAEFADGSKFVLDFQAEYHSSDDGAQTVDYQLFRAAGYMVGKFGSSGQFGFIYPYGGLTLSSATYNNTRFDDYKGKNRLGLVAGTDFFINPNVFFTIEFHLFDESAAYLSAGYRF